MKIAQGKSFTSAFTSAIAHDVVGRSPEDMTLIRCGYCRTDIATTYKEEYLVCPMCKNFLKKEIIIKVLTWKAPVTIKEETDGQGRCD